MNLDCTRLPWKIAAPSFVWPARVGENCRLLKGLVDEVAVTLFQAGPCLEYSELDLPPDLPGLGLSYHVHLPLDLPWSQGAEPVFELVRALLEKSFFLDPHAYVLHPPHDPHLLDHFLRLWSGENEPQKLLLENIQGNDLLHQWSIIEKWDCGICLDIGHLLAFAQQEILYATGLWPRTRMLHAYGPGPGGEHDSLSRLDSHGFALLCTAMANMQIGGTVVLEMFDPEKLHSSLDIFHSWYRNGILPCDD